MNTNLDAVLAFVLSEEGGYSNDPKDSGGPTNHGITQAGLSYWRGHRCSAADIQALAVSEARDIYQQMYWNEVSGDDLPSGIDLMVMDFAVTSGPSTSATMLQRMLGVAQDSIIGPVTLGAAQCVGPVLWHRIAALQKMQDAFYRALPTYARFGAGWSARTTHRQAAAMKLTYTKV